MAESEEKAKYVEVPQNEDQAAKDKEQPDGAVRLQAKMNLVGNSIFSSLIVSFIVLYRCHGVFEWCYCHRWIHYW